MMLTDSARPVLSSSTHLESFENYPGTFLLLDGASARWAFVNRSSLEILKLCDGRHTVAEISETVAQEGQVTDGEARNKTLAFFSAMVKTGLVYDIDERPQQAETPMTSFSGLTIEITKRCNLRCRHCYLAAGDPSEREMTFDEITGLISEANKLGATFINLSGGEPLLREDCFMILDHISDLGMRSVLGTNGTLITADIAQRLADLPVILQISLDGADEASHDQMRGKGAFRRMLVGLDHLLRAGLAKRITLAFTAASCNVGTAGAPIQLALEKGLKGVVFTSLLAGGNARDNWEDLKLSRERELQLWEFIYNARRNYAGQLAILHQGVYLSLDDPGVSKVLCSIGTNLRIDPDGNVYPCQCFVAGKDYRLGNIREQSLEEIVQGRRLQQIKETRYGRIERMEQCRDCVWRHYCGAGCMGNAYHKTGTVYAAPDCELRRRWVKRLFEIRLADQIRFAEAFEQVN